MRALRLLCLLGAVTLVLGKSPVNTRDLPVESVASVIKTASGEFQFVKDRIVKDAHATAVYKNTVNSTGWAFLSVTTASGVAYADEDLAYSAGFAEGALTNASIWLSYLNNGGEATLAPKLTSFLNEQAAWVAAQVKANPTDDYWRSIALIYRQFDGLYDGYVSAVPPEQRFAKDQLWLFSIAGDLETYAPVIKDERRVEGSVFGQDKCSALAKLLPGNSELFISQVTWSSLNSMLRIYKKYDFAFRTQSGGVIPGRVMSFSSYPGTLFSGDDYYQLAPSQLVVLETTIGNGNPALWKYLTTDTVLEFLRNLVANRLAKDAPSWASIFKKYNNGGYNNEFLILDYQQFTPGMDKLKADTLWVLNQVPGHVKAGDVTDEFVQRGGYWPSYNIPYWPEIFNISGGPQAVAAGGEWFSYDKTARALIFARNQSDIVDMDSMGHVMRYNNFKHDPLSRCNCTPGYTAENAISCRDDLMPADGTYPISAFGHRNHAGTDAKMTSKALMEKGSTMAISGPTAEQQPVFSWSTTTFTELQHFGMPDTFDFDWCHVEW